MIDLSRLVKFLKKSYRDSYLQTAVPGSIAYQIRALREQAGLTQQQLAERVGTKQSVISRLEDSEYGRASVQTLLRIASALGVALLVRFVAYPEFLLRMSDVSESGLHVETIKETVDRFSQPSILQGNTPQPSSEFPDAAEEALHRHPVTDQPNPGSPLSAEMLIPNFINCIRYQGDAQVTPRANGLGDRALQRLPSVTDFTQHGQRQLTTVDFELRQSWISQSIPTGTQHV